jgi:pantoate--beta-alanine ligase
MNIPIFTKNKEIKQFLSQKKIEGKNYGFVPTMGALHQGHLDLVKKAGQQHDFVVVSIFVNPTQFNNAQDLEKYPRNLSKDIELLNSINQEVIVFSPEVQEIYPQKTSLKFDFGNLEKVMEGAFRAGHFNGVGLVVSKLFHIIQPQKAYFGQKDLQQCKIIECLVNDLSFDLELVICPTVRETDGLAMSSRNQRLSVEERKEAVKISVSLFETEKMIKNKVNWQEIMKWIESFYKNSMLRLEYFSLVNFDDLSILEEYQQGKKVAICVAAYLGEVRLIDNIIIELP